jgi:hypothetical protein
MAVVLAALIIRCCYVGWGLPFVYEEATPLKKAWTMGGWGAARGVDLNPHFFNYPSLMIYLHFIAQGLLYGAMKVGGTIESGVDFHARYLVDPSPFYYVGRLISVLFGAATVWLTWLVGRRFAAKWAAIAAAALLAVNTYHISRSHLIEVDVPLAFFVMLALWLVLRVTERPTLRNYLIAGAAVGVAASTKYTGAMLLLPLVAAHLFARRAAKPAPPWKYPLLSAAATAVVFLLTSPYVLLDAGTFWKHFSAERLHMRAGHFGVTGSSSWWYYARSIAGPLLGLPAAVLAMAGLVYAAGVRRAGPAVVVAAFVVPYLLAVSTWSMRAERYLLPVLPALLVFAVWLVGTAASLKPVSRWPAAARAAVAVAVCVAMAVPVVGAYPAYLRNIRMDTRTASAEWIEANVPSGSFLVIEPYGPEVFGPQTISTVSTPVRKKVVELKRDTPNYAVLMVPMFQVAPERSGVFYDLPLYENADYIVSTGAVRSRYGGEPRRFARQLAFYDSLETTYTRVAEFATGEGGGSVITIFKGPNVRRPFGMRRDVAPPRPLRHQGGPKTGSEELFYYSMGINYEVFGRLPQAVACYDMAFRYPVTRSASYKNLVMRKTQCLMTMGQVDQAVDYISSMIAGAPTREVREHLQQVRSRIQQSGNDRDR